MRATLIIIPELVRIDVRCAEDTIHLLARRLYRANRYLNLVPSQNGDSCPPSEAP